MYRRRTSRTRRTTNRSHGRGRILIGLAMAAFALISYFGSSTYNPVTGEKQHISITPNQEIAMGLQAAPQMAQQHGGLHPDADAQAYLDEVCNRLIINSVAAETDWPFECHLLADPEAINAFALPGGQMFITAALFNRLETEGQLAGVMGHEIGHVLARHGAQRIAKQDLTQGLTGAAVIAAYDPDDPRGAGAAQMAVLIGNLVNMRYGREDELQSDRIGVQMMANAGYNPLAMTGVMRILGEASQGNNPPEFFSTHPNPENRVAKIETAVAEVFPDGVPDGLTP